MKSLSKWIASTVTTLTLVLSTSALAEQKQTLGEWDVHYMVVNTTFLSPDIAKSYGLVRSKYNALVNISVLDSDSGKAQKVAVKGKATNLLGNSRELTFKRVDEGEAVYYLAVLPFRDQETFRFAITIQHGNTIKELNFKQQLYTDD